MAFTVTAGQAGDAPAFESVMSRIRVPRNGPATRTDKLAIAYQAALHLASILIWIRC
ncbi:hypothetical protein GCM10018780_76390 [Streptomyces lanatus]|nr:hypothetical protein GCM10018780_76390 [Streptomyces lanatus]